jgi:hypothetical protein
VTGEPNLSGEFSPERFPQARLLAADFDGTTHDTFEAPPDGIGVDEAYRIGIERVFEFDEGAVARYEAEGGHGNRTPAEIVHSLAPTSVTSNDLDRLTEELVRVKLDLLCGQIGKPLDDGQTWPRAMPGFSEFWSSVYEARDEGEHISTAILSAGHAPFIRKVFSSAGLELPDILVTEETIRGLNSSLPPDKLAKPAAMPLLLAKTQWLNFYGLDVTSVAAGPQIGDRITVFGDSLPKDGGLAKNSGVNFVHINPEDPAAGYETLYQQLNLGRAALAQTAEHDA